MTISFLIDVPYDKLGLSCTPFYVPMIHNGRPLVLTLRPDGDRYTGITAPNVDDELIGLVLEYAEQKAKRHVRAHLGE